MKVIPIQGMYIRKNINVVVQAFSEQMLFNMLEFKGNKKAEKNKCYIDEFTFVDKNNLMSKIKDIHEVNQILNKFEGTQTFAIINTRLNKYEEFYDLKVALSIIYIAQRWKIENKYSFFRQLTVSHGYFTENGIESTRWDVSIGEKAVDKNDYDLTIPVYYTIDDMEDSWRNIRYEYKYMRIEEDISDEINKISLCIVKQNKFSNKLRSALYLLFNTLKFENKDLVIIMYATILETLLLSENEDNQRKKVSVRAACLIKDLGKYEEKEYIANWVYYFYKYRNAIVHEGKSFIELQSDDEFIVFNHSLVLIQHLIFNLIKVFVETDINSIEDIRNIVVNNKKNDKLNNGFDYISEKMNFNYEED